MCQSIAEGGQRCAAHTRPAFEAAAFGTPEWDEAAAQHASTRDGERALAAIAHHSMMTGDVEHAVAAETALERGKAIRQAAAEFRDIWDRANKPAPALPPEWDEMGSSERDLWVEKNGWPNAAIEVHPDALRVGDRVYGWGEEQVISHILDKGSRLDVTTATGERLAITKRKPVWANKSR